MIDFFFPGLLITFALFLSLAVLILTLVALIDLLQSRFRDNDKIVWAIVIIFVTLIGPVLYLVIGRKQKLGEQGGKQ